MSRMDSGLRRNEGAGAALTLKGRGVMAVTGRRFPIKEGGRYGTVRRVSRGWRVARAAWGYGDAGGLEWESRAGRRRW